MTTGPLLFSVLVAVAVLIGFLGLWRLVRVRDPIEDRLAEYGGEAAVTLDSGYRTRRRSFTRLERLLAGLGMGPWLARKLTLADLPVTAAEYSLVILLFAVVGFVFGTWRLGPLAGLGLTVGLALLPILYLSFRASRRQRAFVQQIPEILTLLVGALRAGYGLTQALEMLIDQLPDPAAKEFARVMQAIGLGLPVQRALNEMADRVESPDWDMVVTAINVQYETGGNLAQTLEIIGETVRDRIRLLRDIRVLTAQQRLTGYVLVALPFAVGFIIFLINRDYILRLFEPGWIRLLPVAALVLQLIGFLIIRRIVDIDV